MRHSSCEAWMLCYQQVHQQFCIPTYHIRILYDRVISQQFEHIICGRSCKIVQHCTASGAVLCHLPHLNRPHVTVKAHFSLALRIFARKLAHELASRALFSGFSEYQAGIGCARVRRSVVVRNSSTTFTMTRIRGYSFNTILQFYPLSHRNFCE